MSEMMARLLVETLLQEAESQGKLLEVFNGVSRRLIQRYRGELAEATPEERAAQLVVFLREEFGCPVEVERMGQRTLIRCYRCPLANLEAACPLVRHLEQGLAEAFVGKPVSVQMPSETGRDYCRILVPT